ncbi:MAG: 2-oxoglutarate dehydrogenase complex dihydrolipoyllysine-residue succinyltransferase [Verrucomicrobiales bacterium]|jgi:2-oxoglutarate dehydrogenase E2 component (dihydrolipoamide succinyltransferase)|nr:2-oxoglutarate dehydrogenase complex dihydrolipoyllysine-residue succinyltransferase [Verrucomicrobiales bacterium]
MISIKVPSVGESITSGVLGAWKKKNGEYVKEGDVLLEIETEKVTSEVFAEKSGVLKQLVAEGTEVKIGQVVGELDETAKAPAGGAAPAAAPTKSEIPLSPAVRKSVEEQNIDPSSIQGSGKGGRILKEDLSRPQAPVIEPTRVPSGPAQEHKPAAPVVVSDANGERITRKKMSPLRKKIAERLVAAQQDAAMLTTFNEVDLSNVIELRKKHQDRFVAKHGVKLGFMSFFVKAAIHALKQVPQVNARIDGEEIVENHFYDIGIAISTDKGLLVPVLRDADQYNLAQIEQAIADYSKKARDGKITLPDLEGGVFTITNGGVFGSMLSTPILNPPQSAILGMHAIIERPVAVSGQVVIRPMMYLALSYDHRLVDGKQAVTFLVRIKEYIENPGLALLDL